MNLLDIATGIWSVRWKAALLAVAAAVVALLLTFDVSLSPLSLTPQALQVGVGQADVLIDAGQSPLADAAIPVQNLAALAETYAELANSPVVVDAVAHSIGVEPGQVSVQEQVPMNVPASQSDPQGPQVGTQIVGQRKHYTLLVRNDQGAFVLQLYTQAPTGRQAIRMADAAATALAKLSRPASGSEPVAESHRVILRRLGRATGGTLDHGAALESAILIAVAIWILGLIAILTFKRLTGDSRRASSGAHPTTV